MSSATAEIGAFATGASRYWLAVFPRALRELRRLRTRAAGIGDPALRGFALEALEKRGNIEGAAACAILAARGHRATVLRALLALQAAYNYTDRLAERPGGDDPSGDAARLHEALLSVLDPNASGLGLGTRRALGDDGGYLLALVSDCRSALRCLPSYKVAAPRARAAAARVVAFQGLCYAGRGELEAWARAQMSSEQGLEPWEIAAAAGSTLGLYALIAAAASPSLDVGELEAIEGAYFPWIDVLNTMLDSLLDKAEDAATGQLNFIDCYRSRADIVDRLPWLTAQALEHARALPEGGRHAALLAAMTCHYLSEMDAAALELAHGVREQLGALATPAQLMFKVRKARAP